MPYFVPGNPARDVVQSVSAMHVFVWSRDLTKRKYLDTDCFNVVEDRGNMFRKPDGKWDSNILDLR